MTVHDFDLPLAPLEQYLGTYRPPDAWVGDLGRGMRSNEQPYNAVDFAELAGCSMRTVVRWRRVGLIPLRWADRIAASLGVHPLCIWAEHYVEWLAA